MRKLVLVCCIGVMITGSAVAEQPANTAWAEKLFGDTTTKDFGTVAKGIQLKYSFKMTNIYAVPLTLSVRVSCDCVKATPSKNVLKPNESATLDINMDTRRINGFNSKTVYVTVGPQFISTAKLTVTANIQQNVVLTPGEIDFGIVQRGKTPTQSIKVEYFGSPGWLLTEIIKNGHAPFNLKVEPLGNQVNDGRQVGYRIYATLKPDAAPGPFKEEILLKTNDPASPVLTFNIIGNIQAALTAAPSLVTFSNVAAGVVQEKQVAIRGSRPFQITSIDGMGQGITCTFAPRSSPIQVLTVRCEMEKPAEVRKILTIHSDLDNESVQVIVEAK